MKYAKFGLIALSVLSMSGCADKNVSSERPTDFLGSMTASVTGSLGAIPETISMYANASETHDELIDVKQQLAQTQKKMQVLLHANEVHVQSLQNERVKLQQEQSTLNLAMRQLKQLKRQLTNQDELLAELHKVLSSAEVDVAALAKRAGIKTDRKNKLSAASQADKPVKTVVKRQKPKPVLQTAQNTRAQNVQQMLQQRKAQQQAQQARIAQQQKQDQQARLRQQQAAAQQARLRQQQAAQRLNARRQQAAQQVVKQQPAQNLSHANNKQLQQILQQRMAEQRSVQELSKAQMPKKLEGLEFLPQ